MASVPAREAASGEWGFANVWRMTTSGAWAATPEDVDEICRALREVEREELAEVITDAWASRAPKSLASAYLGQQGQPTDG